MLVAAAAAILATLAIGLFLYWLAAALSGRRHALHHIRRLAAEIIAVARTIEADLVRGPTAPHATVFRSRSLENRRRADEALGSGGELARLSLQDMENWLERLHEDHRYIVDVRSELDAELAGMIRRAASVHTHLSTPSRPSQWPSVPPAARPSQWPGSGHHTSTMV